MNKAYDSVIASIYLNRMTLSHFGFDTSDDSIKNYRRIINYYYKNPDNYDKDVINAVHYYKHNRLLFYRSKILAKGDKIPDCKLLRIDNNKETETTLYKAIDGNMKYTLFSAFSLS